MARIRLVPVDELAPALRQAMKDSEGNRQNLASFQAAGHLPEAFEAFWAFYAPLRVEGLLGTKLKEMIRLKIANLNECAT